MPMNNILGYLPSLDQLLKSAVQRARQIYGPNTGDGGQDEFRGLYISENEVDTLVKGSESIGTVDSARTFVDSCEHSFLESKYCQSTSG